MKNAIRNLVVLAAATSCTTAFANNVLVWSTGSHPLDTEEIGAYIAASGLFDSVDTYHQMDSVTPDLSGYDSILYFTNSFLEGVQETNGDMLYQFAQGGGRLVLAPFSWGGEGNNSLAGDIIELGASPFIEMGPTTYTSSSMDWNDGSPLFDGVNSLTSPYRNDVALTDGATLHATWADGLPLAASKGNIIAINVAPYNINNNTTGDYAQLFANALAMPVPAPGMLAMLGISTLMTSRRRRL